MSKDVVEDKTSGRPGEPKTKKEKKAAKKSKSQGNRR